MSGPVGEARASNRGAWAVLLCLAAGYLVAAARDQFITGDPVAYLSLARSMVSGEGYRVLGRPHAQYPPGIPLLVAPVVTIGNGIAASQLLIALFAPLSLAVCWRWIRVREPALGVPILVLMVANFGLFTVATSGIRSELPYLVASVGALAILDASDRSGWIRGVPLVPVIAVLAAAAVAFRFVGVSLGVAMLIAWAHRRIRGNRSAIDKALLAGGIAGLAAAVGWLVWGALNPSGISYLDLMILVDPHRPDLGHASLIDILGRIPVAMLRRLSRGAELILNVPWLAPTWSSPITLAIGSTLAIGIGVELRAANPVLGWYLLGYGALLLVWPFDEGVRFLIPVLPMLVLVMVRGLRRAIELVAAVPNWLTVRRSVAVLAIVLAIVAVLEASLAPTESSQRLVMVAAWSALAMATPTLPRPDPRSRRLVLAGWTLVAAVSFLGLRRIVPAAITNATGRYVAPNAALEPGVRWLARNAAPTDVVMAEFAPAVFFHAGLRAVQFPRTARAERLVAAVDSSGARWLIVLDPPKYLYYRPSEVERLAILRGSLRRPLTVAHRFEKGTVYRIE